MKSNTRPPIFKKIQNLHCLATRIQWMRSKRWRRRFRRRWFWCHTQAVRCQTRQRVSSTLGCCWCQSFVAEPASIGRMDWTLVHYLAVEDCTPRGMRLQSEACARRLRRTVGNVGVVRRNGCWRRGINGQERHVVDNIGNVVVSGMINFPANNQWCSEGRSFFFCSLAQGQCAIDLVVG